MATNTYDVLGEGGKAVPYGVDDVGTNTGWVTVGTDADTGVFVVESIRRWWTNDRRSRLSGSKAAADHRGWRWVQRISVAMVEDPARPAGRRDRAPDHRVPPATGHLQVDHDRAPDVLRDHHELARPTPRWLIP